ncbi:MAG: hypothetical protein NWQ38_15965 [Cellulophaga sp.]|nr:hypothetical protein [Cellulophaga sp.]
MILFELNQNKLFIQLDLMKNYLVILGILLLTFYSCRNNTNKEETQNELTLSNEFSQAENQDGTLVNFIFKIDLKEKLIFDQINFYKLNITGYDSIFLGKRNDTIFSYDQ